MPAVYQPFTHLAMETKVEVRCAHFCDYIPLTNPGIRQIFSLCSPCDLARLNLVCVSFHDLIKHCQTYLLTTAFGRLRLPLWPVFQQESPRYQLWTPWQWINFLLGKNLCSVCRSSRFFSRVSLNTMQCCHRPIKHIFRYFSISLRVVLCQASLSPYSNGWRLTILIQALCVHNYQECVRLLARRMKRSNYLFSGKI